VNNLAEACRDGNFFFLSTRRLNAPERESEPAPNAPRMNETKGGWQIDVPDTFSSSLKPLALEYAEDMGRAAHDAGIPAEEANTLFEFVSQHARQQLKGLNIANEREVLAHLSHMYGDTEAKAIRRYRSRGRRACPDRRFGGTAPSPGRRPACRRGRRVG
jgi:hypothetical protein